MKLKDLMRKCIPDDLYLLVIIGIEEDYVVTWYRFRDLDRLGIETRDKLTNSEVVTIRVSRSGLVVQIREPEV